MKISKTTAVSIKRSTKNRLDEWIGKQDPRPVKSDVASKAIEQYLDEQERKANFQIVER